MTGGGEGRGDDEESVLGCRDGRGAARGGGGGVDPRGGRAARGRFPLDYNARANFGGGNLRTGFLPDPWPFRLSAGGGRDAIDVSTLGLHRRSRRGDPARAPS
ncbi:MAG: hypothetical protein M5U28_46820 [Sandaracinaceae bacterium]|nr:hypothetical protein [Sandaracinaceae bacterium]